MGVDFDAGFVAGLAAGLDVALDFCALVGVPVFGFTLAAVLLSRVVAGFAAGRDVAFAEEVVEDCATDFGLGFAADFGFDFSADGDTRSVTVFSIFCSTEMTRDSTSTKPSSTAVRGALDFCDFFFIYASMLLELISAVTCQTETLTFISQWHGSQQRAL